MWTVLAITAAAGVVVVFWLREVRSPRRIDWREADINGITAHRADDLVLQHETPSGAVWATHGFTIYRSRGGEGFERVHTIRPRLGFAWAGYLASARKRFGYQELVEVLPLRDDLLIAFAGGDVFRIDLQRRRRERTHRLRYFGRGKGRGVMAFGLTADGNGSLYYSEYSTLKKNQVGVWRSDDEGRSWALAIDFPHGFVRHLHAVQCDQFRGDLWIGSGDLNPECRVGFSRDGARTFSWIGENSQHYRVCAFLFFEDTVVWGTDADRSPNTTMVLNRSTGRPRPAVPLPAPTFYAQRVDDRTGLLGLAQHAAEVWVVDSNGRAHAWLRWETPTPHAGGLPGIRLARGRPSDPDVLYLNPLRTATDVAAVYRVPRLAMPLQPIEA